MNTIGQISEINFEIGEIFISEWTLSLRTECCWLGLTDSKQKL